MATNTNDVIGNAGTMGEFTIYTRKGVTIVRKKHNLRSKKGQTTASMSQRTKIGNLVAVWHSLDEKLRDCFELRKRGASDYSGFMSANGRSPRVYLPKELADMKASVTDSYTIASGQMQPSILVERHGERWVSDIRVGGLAIGSKTTVGELSGAIVSNNFGNILCYGPVKQTDPQQMPSYEQAVYMQYLESQDQLPTRQQEPAEVMVETRAMPPEGSTVEGGGMLPAGVDCALTAKASAGWRFKCWDDGLTDPTLTLRPRDREQRLAFFEKC